MKIDAIRTLIAVAISVLLAYACYEICDYERVRWAITIGAFLTIVIPSILSMGVATKESRTSLMLAILSWVGLILEIAVNFTFVFFDFSIPSYVIVNGIIICLYALTYSSMYRTQKRISEDKH